MAFRFLIRSCERSWVCSQRSVFAKPELLAKRLDDWRFKRQVPIEGYIVDFICLEARLIVEMDGPLHRRPERQAKDAARDAVLRGQGFTVLRFNDKAALGSVVDEIRRALSASPAPGP